MATAFWIVIGFISIIAAIAISYLLHRREIRKGVRELLQHPELLDKPSQIKTSIRRYNNNGNKKESYETFEKSVEESSTTSGVGNGNSSDRLQASDGGEQIVEGAVSSTTTADEHELDGDLQVPTPSGDQQPDRSNKKRSKRNRFNPI